jgi:hypothetical protein
MEKMVEIGEWKFVSYDPKSLSFTKKMDECYIIKLGNDCRRWMIGEDRPLWNPKNHPFLSISRFIQLIMFFSICNHIDGFRNLEYESLRFQKLGYERY